MKTLLTAGLFFALAAPGGAAEMPWLTKVTAPPASFPEPDPPLRPVLVRRDGQPITTLADWHARREAIRADWLRFLGPLPQPPTDMKLEIVSEERLEHCTRSLVRYEVEPGRVIEAFLLRPHNDTSKQRPGIVLFHPTNADNIHVVAGLRGREDQQRGLRLVERGFVVLCPRNFLWEDPNQPAGMEGYAAAAEVVRRRHPESKAMATMLADGMRAVDVLVSLPDVDPERIGTTGHSLGAKESLYLAAFDDRVKAAVSSEGGVGLGFSNWDAPWYLGPQVKELGFGRDHHELIALIAPRPLLVLGGEEGRGCADGDRSWPYIAVGQQVARLYGEPVHQGLFNHGQGHRFSPEVAAKAFDWLEHYLTR